MFVITKHMFKTFVATKLGLLWQSQQKHIFCRDKIFKCHFLSQETCVNIILLRQTYFCRDKHNFVATNILLLRQKTCFGATTKKILVAFPTDDGKPVVWNEYRSADYRLMFRALNKHSIIHIMYSEMEMLSAITSIRLMLLIVSLLLLLWFHFALM